MSFEAKEPQNISLRKVLGIPDGVAILVGITIGAGIYSTPQIIAGYQESFLSIITLWLIVGIFVFIGSLIYAELGTRFPNTGGEYIYISRTFGPFVGFLFGWTQLFIIRTSATAGLSIIAVNYLGYFFNMNNLVQTCMALFIIIFLGLINYIGIQQASSFQKITTLIKVTGLFLLVSAGLFLVDSNTNLISTRATSTQNLGLIGNTVAAIMLIVFTHTGWDRVGYSAGEMKNPKKVIPSTMFIGIGIIIFLYISVNFVYYNVLGIEGLRASTIVASDTAIKLIGPTGGALIALLVLISAMGSINGTMMTAPRVYYAMSKDGLFFKWLNYVHPKYQTPSRAVIAHCTWAAFILIVRGQFETIAAGMVFAVLIFYAFTTAALFKLRKTDNPRDIYKIPLFPVLPAIFFIGIVLLLFFRAFYEWEKSLVDLAFIASGIPFALIWIRRKKKVF